VSGDCAAAEAELNRLMAEGRFLDGFERFYADDVVMRENDGPERQGKERNRAREAAFHARLKRMTATLLGGAVDGNLAYSEWRYVIEFANGEIWDYCQMAARRWQDGRIVRERFYHRGFPKPPA
jgi:hypothetical protein